MTFVKGPPVLYWTGYRLRRGQLLHHISSHHKAGAGRNPGYAAGNAAAARRRGLTRLGDGGKLRRPENCVVNDAPLAQFLTHHARQRAALRLRQVRNAKLRGIQFVASAQSRDDRKASADGSLDQIQLAGD